MGFDVFLNRVLGQITGFNVRRARPDFEFVRRRLIKSGAIDEVLDGGANEGQWAKNIIGLCGRDIRITSFEPLRMPYQKLELAAAQHENWAAKNVALGEDKGDREINVASNGGQSSSLREPQGHVSAYPSVEFLSRESVAVDRLDNLVSSPAPKYLKLDVQGYEREALAGAAGILDSIVALEIETSFIEMYEGQPTHYEFVPEILDLGFSPISMTTPATLPNGTITYVDVLFSREPVK